MRSSYWIVLFLIISNKVICQTNFNKMWHLGVSYKYDVDFKTNPITTSFSDSNILFQYDASSCISDSNGNLLLSSSGYNIVKNNQFVDGADSLGGRDFIDFELGWSSYSQSSLFLPFSNSIYYFVNGSVSDSNWYEYNNSPNPDAYFDELMYTKIDMKGNGGAGKLLQREIKLLEHETLGMTQMMACKHANGKDWWLLKQARGQNKVFKFLFTQDSVYNMGTQSFVAPFFSYADNGGQLMFSQDGSKIASTCRGTGQIFVGDFNRCNGVISNPKVFTIPAAKTHWPLDTNEVETHTEGLAFSSNGRFVYVSMWFNVQQLDLQDNDTTTQWAIVAGLDTTWDEFQRYSCMYLGPDNKLYVGNWGGLSKQMSYFSTPNSKGIGSGFCPRCLRFPDFGVSSPPCMPNYDLGKDSSWCWPLSYEELKVDDDVIVYPNPAIYLFTVRHSFEKGEIITVDLYDNLSRKVKTISYKRSSVENSIHVENLSTGLYYYNISIDGVEVKKGKLTITK